MRFQTIPSTVPENPPAITQQFDELAATGGPDWLFPVLVIAAVLIVGGAALVWLAEWWKVRR